MSKLMAAITLLLATSGCFYQDVSISGINRATYFCKDIGGVVTIRVFSLGAEQVYCADGNTELVSEIILPPSYWEDK